MTSQYANEVMEVGFTTHLKDERGLQHLVIVRGQADVNGWKYRTIEDSLGDYIYKDDHYEWIKDDKAWNIDILKETIEKLNELL